MTEAWPGFLPSWLTPEEALNGWQQRIARVAQSECAHFASLPYVRGLAIIGSIARGTPWPLSDLDLLVVADPRDGSDPEPLIRTEEQQRNHLLHAARIPSVVEAANWVFLAGNITAAVATDQPGFLQMLRHPHWTGMVIKSAGANVITDCDGTLRSFLDRCNSILWHDSFIRLWLTRSIDQTRHHLTAAQTLLHRNEIATASAHLILASTDAAHGLHAIWRQLPQSPSRGVTRLLNAAVVNDTTLVHAFLRAARLTDPDVHDRITALPASGRHERAVWCDIRMAASEPADERSATRDFLHLAARRLLQSTPAPHPPWTGVTHRLRAVQDQLAGTAILLERLETEMASLKNA